MKQMCPDCKGIYRHKLVGGGFKCCKCGKLYRHFDESNENTRYKKRSNYVKHNN